MHERNCFITLTYDQEHLPSDRGLRVEDFQKFAKRLRKRCGSFRFYHCGEYGSRNLRPHYHALLFGLDFAGDRVQIQEKPYPRFRSSTLDEVWGLGRTDVGNLTYETAAYCARYVHKAEPGRPKDLAPGDDDPRLTRFDPDTGECWQVRREYSTMSRNPGLGARWLEKFHTDVYPSDEVVHNGQSYPVPRYYDERVQSPDFSPKRPPSGVFSVLVEDAKDARRRASMKRKEDLTPERLAVRERNAVARLRLRRREL